MRTAGLLSVLVALVLVLGACGGTNEATDETAAQVEQATITTAAEKPTRGKPVVVARVIDGDTIELRNGRRVRLVQIDSPEVGESECFSEEATTILSAILPRGTNVRLEADPKLDSIDRYDRLLRYLFKGKRNVNVVLVQRGAAAPWFYEGDRGRYAKRLLAAANRAKSNGRGLWSACPGTDLDPTRAIDTGTPSQATDRAGTTEEPATTEAATSETESTCHPSYEGACLDPSVSDYDCQGGSGNGPGYTGTVTVVGPDEYELDGDGDGIGCA